MIERESVDRIPHSFPETHKWFFKKTKKEKEKKYSENNNVLVLKYFLPRYLSLHEAFYE